MKKNDNNNHKLQKSSYQRQLKSSNTEFKKGSYQPSRGQNLFKERTQARIEGDEIDLKFGFERLGEVCIINLLYYTFSFRL